MRIRKVIIFIILSLVLLLISCRHNNSANKKDDLKFIDLAYLDFVFSSGDDTWATKINIYEDGLFSGHYFKNDINDTGYDYPNGTYYSRSFSGRFSPMSKINDYQYSLKLENISPESLADKIRFGVDNGIRYVKSPPYGVENAKEFILYLPGEKVEDLPEDFLRWASMQRDVDFERTKTLDFWGLYNVDEGYGFTASIIDPIQDINVSWKGIYGGAFFDLYVVINGKDYYVGNFSGINLWDYERKKLNTANNILAYFHSEWTGAGSDFYLMRKSETELAVMYHAIPYKSNMSEFEWDDYEEVLVIPIEKDKAINIRESIIFREIVEGEPLG